MYHLGTDPDTRVVDPGAVVATLVGLSGVIGVVDAATRVTIIVGQNALCPARREATVVQTQIGRVATSVGAVERFARCPAPALAGVRVGGAHLDAVVLSIRARVAAVAQATRQARPEEHCDQAPH